MASDTSTGQIVPSKSTTMERTGTRDTAMRSSGSRTAARAATPVRVRSPGTLLRRGSSKRTFRAAQPPLHDFEEVGMARRLLVASPLAVGLMLVLAAPALACGGLVAQGHAEVLRKATTLAAWHDGFEHYVTGFQFAGGADRFGYIVPLPGVPTKIQKGGNWTLERLEREINPVQTVALAAASPVAFDRVAVLQRVKIDALDIVVVRGGGRDVAAWAEKNG